MLGSPSLLDIKELAEQAVKEHREAGGAVPPPVDSTGLDTGASAQGEETFNVNGKAHKKGDAVDSSLWSQMSPRMKQEALKFGLKSPFQAPVPDAGTKTHTSSEDAFAKARAASAPDAGAPDAGVAPNLNVGSKLTYRTPAQASSNIDKLIKQANDGGGIPTENPNEQLDAGANEGSIGSVSKSNARQVAATSKSKPADQSLEQFQMGLKDGGSIIPPPKPDPEKRKSAVASTGDAGMMNPVLSPQMAQQLQAQMPTAPQGINPYPEQQSSNMPRPQHPLDKPISKVADHYKTARENPQATLEQAFGGDSLSQLAQRAQSGMVKGAANPEDNLSPADLAQMQKGPWPTDKQPPSETEFALGKDIRGSPTEQAKGYDEKEQLTQELADQQDELKRKMNLLAQLKSRGPSQDDVEALKDNSGPLKDMADLASRSMVATALPHEEPSDFTKMLANVSRAQQGITEQTGLSPYQQEGIADAAITAGTPAAAATSVPFHAAAGALGPAIGAAGIGAGALGAALAPVLGPALYGIHEFARGKYPSPDDPNAKGGFGILADQLTRPELAGIAPALASYSQRPNNIADFAIQKAGAQPWRREPLADMTERAAATKGIAENSITRELMDPNSHESEAARALIGKVFPELADTVKGMSAAQLARSPVLAQFVTGGFGELKEKLQLQRLNAQDEGVREVIMNGADDTFKKAHGISSKADLDNLHGQALTDLNAQLSSYIQTGAHTKEAERHEDVAFKHALGLAEFTHALSEADKNKDKVAAEKDKVATVNNEMDLNLHLIDEQEKLIHEYGRELIVPNPFSSEHTMAQQTAAKVRSAQIAGSMKDLGSKAMTDAARLPNFAVMENLHKNVIGDPTELNLLNVGGGENTMLATLDGYKQLIQARKDGEQTLLNSITQNRTPGAAPQKTGKGHGKVIETVPGPDGHTFRKYEDGFIEKIK